MTLWLISFIDSVAFAGDFGFLATKKAPQWFNIERLIFWLV
jgi:hypothetical protein